VAASEAAFSGSPIVDPAILDTLHREADGFTWLHTDAAAGPIDFLVATGSFASRGEARRAIAGGGVTVNGHRLLADDTALPAPVAGAWYVVRLGKRRVRIGRFNG
jgi:tyrosyl-tRNA synthetase